MRTGAWRSVSRAFFLAYTLGLLYLMLFGFGRGAGAVGGYRYNLVPFHEISRYMNARHFGTMSWAINILGNIGVFIPLGLLPGLWGWSYRKLMSRFLCFIFTVELVQMLSRRGSFDIDDVILNTIGVTLGFIMSRIIHGWYKTFTTIENDSING